MSRIEYPLFARPSLLPHCLERLVVAVRHWLVAKEQERVEASQRRADTGFATIQKIRLCVFLAATRSCSSPHFLEKLVLMRSWPIGEEWKRREHVGHHSIAPITASL